MVSLALRKYSAPHKPAVRSALFAGNVIVVAIKVTVVAFGLPVDAVAPLEVGDVAATFMRVSSAHAMRESLVKVGAVVVDALIVGFSWDS